MDPKSFGKAAIATATVIGGVLLLAACGPGSNTGGVSGAATVQPTTFAASPSPGASAGPVMAVPPVEFTVPAGKQTTAPFHIAGAPWRITLSMKSQQCSTARAVVNLHRYGNAQQVVEDIDADGCDLEVETINTAGDFYLEVTAINGQVHVAVTRP